ncbi:MAG: hypothetical protein HQL08_07660 [Nitrospirae bacterium]|nr:hypothetical protein [Nitrospirota bacterium]
MKKDCSFSVGVFAVVRLLTTSIPLVCVSLICFAGSAGAEWLSEGDFNVVYDNNLSRSLHESDRKGDTAVRPRVSLGNYIQLSGPLGLSVTANAGGDIYTEYKALNNINLGMTVSLKYKIGLGPYAPWVKGYGSVQYSDYEENMRDGASFITGIMVGKRLHERIDIKIGYEHESMHAHNSLFDQLSDTASVRTDISVIGPLNLLLGYAIKKGNVAVYNAADADSVVIAYTFHEPMEIYKIRAVTQTFTVGLGMPLADHLSADFSSQFSTVRGDDGSRYPDAVFRLGINYSF